MPAKKNTPSPWKSLVAGAVAGSVEAVVTYPAEFIKTQMQLRSIKTSPVKLATSTIASHGVRGLYKGLSTQVIGTASKAGVRFLCYDYFKQVFQPLGFGGMILAGALAGVTEGALVVTPTESIKTKLINDTNRSQPRYANNNLIQNVSSIVKEFGWRSLYDGVAPVVLRQGANSAVRLGSYGIMKESYLDRKIETTTGNSNELRWYESFGLGMVAGVITVYTTMPVDVIKTRMQGRGTYHGFIPLIRDNGWRVLWSGTTPRLTRLVFSGAIVFSVYEQVVKMF